MSAVALAAALLLGAGPDAATPRFEPRAIAWRDGELLAAAQREPGQRLGFAEGTLLGVLELSAPWRDYRGQLVGPGRYALRYALQPRLKEHVGRDAIRDAALLVPAALPGSTQPQASGEWLAAARHVEGSPHPAVLALVPADPTPAEALPPEAVVATFRLVDRALGLLLAGSPAATEAF